MLFKQRFHSGLRDGSITLTFRAWKAPRVNVGARHRLGPKGVLEIRSVDEVPVAGITAREARRAGFEDRDELVALLGKARTVYRVAFRYVAEADPREARRADIGAKALDEVAARLERMDRLSRRGPWTRKVLELIRRQPQVAASKLAPHLGRETRAFKADVRKLKELGLTESFEVGYALSPRGKALLDR